MKSFPVPFNVTYHVAQCTHSCRRTSAYAMHEKKADSTVSALVHTIPETGIHLTMEILCKVKIIGY